MRGKIIQYNGADGSGTIVADGKQYRFALAAWRGDKAPALNKTVEMELDGDAVTSVSAVGDDVLMKERAAQMSNRLGAMWKQASSSARAGGTSSAQGGAAAQEATTATPGPLASALTGVPVAGSIVQRYGIVIPIAWLLFLIGTLAFATVSISMSGFSQSHELSKSMFGTGAGGGAGGFFVRFLLILGYLSIVVPMLWRDRRAWLALLLPLIAVLWSWIYASHLLGEAHAKFDSLVGKYQDMATFAGHPISLDIGHGFGFWLALIMALIVAVCAAARYLGIDLAQIGRPPVTPGPGPDTPV